MYNIIIYLYYLNLNRIYLNIWDWKYNFHNIIDGKHTTLIYIYFKVCIVKYLLKALRLKINQIVWVKLIG